jgi:hypothetical protein
MSTLSMLRATDGKTRLDMPNTTIITNPMTQQVTVLDHLKQTAQILPMKPGPPGLPPLPGMPPMPQAPGAPPPPQMPPVTVQNLGKSMIDGHPVDGMRYIVQPPPPPALPQAPKMPQAPGAPALPQAPKAPPLPPMPTVAEIWTSTPFKMPVLTKVTGPGGVQTISCKPAAVAEPNPSVFQIPAGYKVLPPPKIV